MKSALAHLMIVIAAASFTWVCGFHLTAPIVAAEWSTTEILSGHPRVIDGDTIEINGRHIRLFGIDAPEHDQRCTRNGAPYACGDEATKALSKKIGGKAITCEQRDTDKYRRVVAVCTASGEDINRWMVDQGHAIAYRQYSTGYVPDEERAQAANRGLWAGSFDKPWDFRHAEHRTDHSEKHVTNSSKTHPCRHILLTEIKGGIGAGKGLLRGGEQASCEALLQKLPFVSPPDCIPYSFDSGHSAKIFAAGFLLSNFALR